VLRPGLLRQPPVDSHSVWAVGDVGLRRRLRHRLGQHPSHLFHHPLRWPGPGESDLGEPQQLWTARARVEPASALSRRPRRPLPAAHALHAGASCVEERCTATSRTLCPISSQVCGRAPASPLQLALCGCLLSGPQASGNWTLSTGGAGAGTLLSQRKHPRLHPQCAAPLLLNMTGARAAAVRRRGPRECHGFDLQQRHGCHRLRLPPCELGLHNALGVSWGSIDAITLLVLRLALDELGSVHGTLVRFSDFVRKVVFEAKP